MSNEALNHIVYSKNVIEFVTVANEYCAFIEKHSQHTRAGFIEKAQKLFPLLYLKASLLTPIESDEEDFVEKFVSEVDYNHLLNKLSAKLGQFDSYQEVFDENMQYSETSVAGSIAENLCDIYQDLKDFIMAYRIGNTEIMKEALSECQGNFVEFWGQKLVNGLRAIHNLLYNFNIDLNEEEQIGEANFDEEQNPENWVSKHFSSHSDNHSDKE